MFNLETRKAGMKEREGGLGIDNSFLSQETLVRFSGLYLKFKKKTKQTNTTTTTKSKQTNKYPGLQLNLRVLHMSGKCSPT